MKIVCLLGAAAMLAACTTTKDVRSGRAWEDAKPADYSATKEQVVAEVSKFMSGRGYHMKWADDQSFVRGYKRGDSPVDQNIELHVKIESSPVAGMTRVTAISGRSLGVEWKGREVHERLHAVLRDAFASG